MEEIKHVALAPCTSQLPHTAIKQQEVNVVAHPVQQAISTQMLPEEQYTVSGCLSVNGKQQQISQDYTHQLRYSCLSCNCAESCI